MTSNRKIEANRRNSQRSTGPRSAAGKSIASRNARRHGLAALMARSIITNQELEEFVGRLCDTDSNSELRERALEVAKQEWFLRTIRAQQAEAVERLRDPWLVPLSCRDNSLELAKACSMSAWLADWEIKRALPTILYKYRDSMSEEVRAQYENLRRAEEERKKQLEMSSKRKSSKKGNRVKKETEESDLDKLRPWPIQDENADEPWLNYLSRDSMQDDPGGLYLGLVPLWLKALMTDNSSLEEEEQQVEWIKKTFERRDDLEALEVATPDLKRLERYERRVWSALKRAYRVFIVARSMST
jgi:hypothetical protein